MLIIMYPPKGLSPYALGATALTPLVPELMEERLSGWARKARAPLSLVPGETLWAISG